MIIKKINSIPLIKKIRNKAYHLLRWTEKWTKTDMIYLSKGGFWLTLGQVVSSLSAFIITIAFANLIPKETYGTYKYVLSILGILTIPTLSGINTAITRAIAQGNDGSFLPALKLKIHWGLLGGLASLSLAGYYYLQGNIELTFAFLIASIFIPFMDSFGLYASLFQGKKRFDISTKYGIWIKIIASIFIFIALYFTRNLFAILFTYLAGYTLLKLLSLKFSLKYIENKKEDAGAISYGKHLSLMRIISSIATQIDKIIVYYFIGPTELAIYSIAIAMPEQIKGLLKNINILAFPKFAEKSVEEIKKSLHKKIWRLSFVLFFIVVTYWFFSPIVFKLFFPEYSESVIYSKIFSLGLLNIPIVFLGLPFLQSQGLKKELYKIQFSSSFIQIILIVSLTYFYGLMGLILARLIFRLIVAIIYLIHIKKV